MSVKGLPSTNNKSAMAPAFTTPNCPGILINSAAFKVACAEYDLALPARPLDDPSFALAAIDPVVVGAVKVHASSSTLAITLEDALRDDIGETQELLGRELPW